MVGIYSEVSLAGDFEIKDSMLCKESEHVVQELHTGLHVAQPAPIKIQGDGHLRLACGSAYGCCSSVHVDSRAPQASAAIASSRACSADKSRSFSSRVP